MTWLYVPSACAPEAAGLTLASTLELDERGSEALAQSAWWRGKRSPSPLWRRRWSKVAWLRRLSGVTCAPSTLAHGVASWIASLAATPANHSASPAIAAAKTTSVTSGQMSLEFFESASPPGASSRTSPVICLSEDTTSSESFKRWASALRAHCGQRRKSALRIGESVSSSLLPTPTASTYGSNKGGASGRTGPERMSLETMARHAMWPTPKASDGQRGGGSPAEALRNSPCLPATVRLWPTPSATLGTNGGLVTPEKAREGGTLIEALSARTTWPTPTIAGNYNRKGASPTSGDGLATAVGGQLNPTWVEWLMGWPLGWSASACSEMASPPSKPPKRLSNSTMRSPEAAE